jgi:serine/threonine-protein kinase
VRVVDFGMVRVEESDLTRAGASVGTLNYMAPEQIRGERCSAASDVFSAGIVFYQLASGQHPFSQKGWSLMQVVSAIVYEAPPPLSGVCPDAPEGLEFVLHKALEKDAAKRLQNAGDLKQAVGLCQVMIKLRGAPAAHAPAPAPAPVAAGQTRMMPAGAGGAVASAPVADVEKTKIMKRAALAGGVIPPSPRPQAAPVVTPPPPAQAGKSKFRYCSSCTTANPPAATICRGCGSPLGGAEVPALPESQTPWGMYLAIGVAALLAIALLVVLIVKK